MANTPQANPADKPDDKPTAKAPATKTYTVAKGRSLVVDVTEDDVTLPKSKIAGDKVDLTVAEGKRLIALGFLLNEDGAQVVQAAGGPPTENGKEITEPTGASAPDGGVKITQG